MIRAASSAGQALEAATDALAAADCDTPRLDAEVLLAEACGVDRAVLAASPERGVEPAPARRFGEMVRRRVAREPVAYILGRKGFRHIELAVDPRVLVPRPETELLVELALEVRPGAVLDVGTGSGAVALAVSQELGEDVSVTGVDTSPGAIEVARLNAQRLNLSVELRRVCVEPGHDRVERAVTGNGWDLVLANLPYVRAGDWQALPPEIREYEPREALVAGPTGLEAIERLLADIALTQATIGAIGLEVGEGQADAVAELTRRAGFDRVEARPDLAGIERVIVGVR